MSATALPRLRPLGIGELLDQTIRLYRRNFLTFIGIIALLQIPLTLLQTLMTWLTSRNLLIQMENPSTPSAANPYELFGPEYFIGIGGSCVLAIVSLVLLRGIATAALTRAIADQYLDKPVGVMAAYRRIGRSWTTLVAALVIGSLLAVGLAIWLLVPCVGWFTGIGALAFWGMAIMPLIAPIVVLEKRSPGQAISRAWDLTRRRFWWVVAFVGLLYVFNQLIVTGPVLVCQFLFQFLIRSWGEIWGYANLVTAQTLTQAMLGLVLSLIYLPLELTGMTLLYFDLRVRTEGFDLSLQAESALGEEADAARIAAPPPASTSLVTSTEAGYFVLLSLAAAAVYFVFVAIGMGAGMAITGLPF